MKTTIGLVLLMASCTTIPKQDALEQIREIPFEKDTFNCKHKSKMYNATIQEDVYKSDVVIGYFQGKPHAWVEYQMRPFEQWRLADPTIRITAGKPRKLYDNTYKTEFKLNDLINGKLK